jgi:hypothetical protein
MMASDRKCHGGVMSQECPQCTSRRMIGAPMGTVWLGDARLQIGLEGIVSFAEIVQETRGGSGLARTETICELAG